MPRVYNGPFAEATIRHPITGAWLVVERGEPTTQLDDVGDDVDLGPEWVSVDEFGNLLAIGVDDLDEILGAEALSVSPAPDPAPIRGPVPDIPLDPAVDLIMDGDV